MSTANEVYQSILKDLSDYRFITGTFEGSGDSSNYSSIVLTDTTGLQVKIEDLPDSLSEAITKIMDYIVDNKVDWDWYNNEGGGVTITIDVETGEAAVEGYRNTIETLPMSGGTLDLLEE